MEKYCLCSLVCTEPKGQKERKKFFKYCTRILFVSFLLASAFEIISAVCFMIFCRNNIRQIVNVIDLPKQPCTGLATPAYIACAVVFATIFGFGCLGRKTSSIVLFILGLCDIGLAMYILLKVSQTNIRVEQISRTLNTTFTLCRDAGNEHQTEFSPAKVKQLQQLFTNCKEAANVFYAKCYKGGEWNSTVTSLNMEMDAEYITKCSQEVTIAVQHIKDQYFAVSVPLMFVLSFFYILGSISLYFVQRYDKKFYQECYKDSEQTRSANGTRKQCVRVSNHYGIALAQLCWSCVHSSCCKCRSSGRSQTTSQRAPESFQMSCHQQACSQQPLTSNYAYDTDEGSL